MADADSIQITLLWSPAAREIRECVLWLHAEATVADALAQSGLLADSLPSQREGLGIGIWGCRAALSQRLCSGDRIEICRPLRVDPKKARRERFTRQGARGAGLFSAKRAGAKAGY